MARKREFKSAFVPLGRRKMLYTDEARYISERALSNDGRVVAVGPLVFFSTETGDAWALDPEDQFARCLVRGGERLEHGIIETAERFSVEWNSRYEIRGDLMIFSEPAGRSRTVMGYPVREIEEAIERMTQSRQSPDQP